MQDNRIDVAYLRLSLEDEDVAKYGEQESVSIGSQRLCINEFVRTRDNMPKVLEEFVDDGYSGTNMDRPAMSRLLQLVTMGKVRTIIVRDLSRFARNYLEAGHYLEYVLPAYDVRFVSINDNYDSAEVTYGDSSGFQLAIRNLLNDLYSKDLSRKIKSAVDIKKMNGEYVYGQAPYGYKKGVKKNTIVIDPVAAEVVKRIFNEAAGGTTVTQIARMLNSEKVLTPSVYLAEIRGKYKTRPYWSFESVRNILDNRIYTGDTVPFKSRVVRVGSDRVKQLTEEEQIVIPDTHEAIISRETFYQAKTVIKSNKKSKKKNPTNVFSGYLVCGCCGKRLVKGRPTNKNWLCASARYTDETDCKDIRLNEAKMKDKLLSAIRLQCDLADAKIAASKAVKSRVDEKCNGYNWELKRCHRELDDNRNTLMALLEDFYEEKLSKEEFHHKKQALKDREAELTSKIAELEELVQTAKKEATVQQNIETDASEVIKHRDITEVDSSLMKELVKEIRVYPENFVKIVWNFKETA